MGKSLRELEIVVADCQTTGATPDHGHLIELAWGVVSAACPEAAVIRSYTVRLPEGEALPRRIRFLTGITEKDLASGIQPAEAWWLFEASLRKPSGGWMIPVAHYSRFEKLWLESLRRETGATGPFPVNPVCTREIARRLYPGLPRKGLHALSGYLGRTMSELKRAKEHAQATAFVWSMMVSGLEALGIDRMEKLMKWLEEPLPEAGGARTYPLSRGVRLSLPEVPGVYRFYGADGKLLYVGKATSLRHRVSSYFTKRRADEKTLELVTQVHDLRTTPCGSPLEAALLECRLIRRLKPPYNRAMKSGDENLWFCSEDRTSWGNSPAKGLCIGPFVTREAHYRLGFLNDLVSGKFPLKSGEIVSMFHLERVEFEPGAMEDGVAMLRDCLILDGRLHSLHHLLGLGRDLWLEMLEKREREEDGEVGDDEAEETGEPRKLTADDVFSILRWTVADVALHERRLRWFRLLAWSTVSWKPPSDESAERRFIVIRNGAVARSGSGIAEDTVPPPLDRSVPVLSRTGYETLRVLTGEIRRVSAACSGIEVLLPTERRLEGDALARLLRMV